MFFPSLPFISEVNSWEEPLRLSQGGMPGDSASRACDSQSRDGQFKPHLSCRDYLKNNQRISKGMCLTKERHPQQGKSDGYFFPMKV